MREAIADSSRILESNTSIIDVAMRAFAAIMVIWSIGLWVMLLIQSRPQPTRFIPLIMTQEQSQEERRHLIAQRREEILPRNSRWLIGDRTPLERVDWDADLSLLPQEKSRYSTLSPAYVANWEESFNDRLFRLTVGVEALSKATGHHRPPVIADQSFDVKSIEYQKWNKDANAISTINTTSATKHIRRSQILFRANLAGWLSSMRMPFVVTELDLSLAIERFSCYIHRKRR